MTDVDERSIRAIESSDTDELIRIVDGYAASRSWDAMVKVRERCEEAVTRGKQVWGVSEYIRYRLALDAPGEWAGPAVGMGPSRFTLGPLPEVAASKKTWAELEAHLPEGPERAMTAHERVVRGERLEHASLNRLVLELPLELQVWEPEYPVATYKPDRVDAPTPRGPRFPAGQPVGEGRADSGDADGARALGALVEHWEETSNGRVEVSSAEGDADSALGALGVSRAALVSVTFPEAMAWMAWAAASGGAHGRRRGAAAGRFNAWWAASELAGLEWPPDPGELGEAGAELRWFLWSDGSPDTGWALRLAVSSPAEGLSWALNAIDAD